jgi:hypothetical protein
MVANLYHRLYLILDSLRAIGVALHEVAAVLIDNYEVVAFV